MAEAEDSERGAGALTAKQKIDVLSEQDVIRFYWILSSMVRGQYDGTAQVPSNKQAFDMIHRIISRADDEVDHTSKIVSRLQNLQYRMIYGFDRVTEEK